MAFETTYLVTGATRGIGLAIVDLLRAQSTVRVIVGVRDVKRADAASLASKPNVIVVEIDSKRDDTPFLAAKAIQAQGIQAIDVVIANAGIAGVPTRLSDSTAAAAALRETFNVNAVAPVLLFAAMKPLLQRSKRPRFLVTSSICGSLQQQEQVFTTFECNSDDGTPQPQHGVYATSKAAANMLTKRIALEEPWLTALPVHPGAVATDMTFFDKDTLPSRIADGSVLTAEDSAKRIIKLAETAQQQTHSGRFYDVQTDGFTAF